MENIRFAVWSLAFGFTFPALGMTDPFHCICIPTFKEITDEMEKRHIFISDRFVLYKECDGTSTLRQSSVKIKELLKM